jgi:hypothetical protein
MLLSRNQKQRPLNPSWLSERCAFSLLLNNAKHRTVLLSQESIKWFSYSTKYPRLIDGSAPDFLNPLLAAGEIL